jgi:hypothetical protein
MDARRQHLDEQVRRNLSTAGSFADFAGHRSHVMKLLAAAARDADVQNSVPRASSCQALTILGAGNCNDVDLPALLALFQHVYLVDCDPDALSRGIAAQGLAGEARITPVAPIDLLATNVQPTIAGLVAGDHRPAVVASLCVVSQLVDSALALKDEHNRDVPEVVVRQHLKLMADLLPEGGLGLLVTDFASSTTAPELLTTAESQLPVVAFKLLSAGNFFRGLHPGLIHRLLTTDPDFRNRIDSENPTPPWNWTVGNRVYAVSAIRMRRKLATTGITSR